MLLQHKQEGGIIGNEATVNLRQILPLFQAIIRTLALTLHETGATEAFESRNNMI